MDIEYLLVLQDFREGAGQFLRELFMKMTFLTDKETSIVIVAIIYWCISKEYGSWLWLGWSVNRLINGFLKVTACAYRPWILHNVNGQAVCSRGGHRMFKFGLPGYRGSTRSG